LLWILEFNYSGRTLTREPVQEPPLLEVFERDAVTDPTPSPTPVSGDLADVAHAVTVAGFAIGAALVLIAVVLIAEIVQRMAADRTVEVFSPEADPTPTPVPPDTRE
jgi:hypothetical protein